MLVLSFLTNQKQKSGFQQWWSGNEKYFYFLFIASRGLLRGLLQEMKGDFFEQLYNRYSNLLQLPRRHRT